MGKRVLVITASIGNGHISAAAALQEALRAEGWEVEVVDWVEVAPPFLGICHRGGYEFLVRHFPAGWGWLYHLYDQSPLVIRLKTAVDAWCHEGLKKIIRASRPDWVLCLHPQPLPALATIRKEVRFRLGVVMTDLYPFALWLRGEPDVFFVPSEWSRQVVEDRLSGAQAQTVVTGIPVRQFFQTQLSRADACRELGFTAARPLIVVASGGIGGGPLYSVVHALLRMPGDCQLAVVAGRNKVTQKKLQRLERRFAGRLVVYGHLAPEHMASLMRASTILISKAGGLTLFEVFASGCLLIVYTPFVIPGQEIPNKDFLLESGAGIVAHTTIELTAQVQRLVREPLWKQDIMLRCRRLARPYAAAMIARLLGEK